MLASQSEIRSRIEDLRLSQRGYSRQLSTLDLTPERRERLKTEVTVLEEEMAALGSVLQLGRVEPDRGKMEAAARVRLDDIHRGLVADPTLAAYSPEERDLASGEARALRWLLGEEPMALRAATIVERYEHADPGRTDRALPSVLTGMLKNGPNTEARASAAFELGKLGIEQAIPALISALDDDPLVAEMALSALARFADEDLKQAGVDRRVLKLVAEQRGQDKTRRHAPTRD